MNTERQSLDRLFQIKKEMDKLQAEKRNLMRIVGTGVHRSKSHPGIVLKVTKRGFSSSIDWKGLAMSLARRLNLNPDAIMKLKETHRFRYTCQKAVSFSPDTAKNPRVLPI